MSIVWSGFESGSRGPMGSSCVFSFVEFLLHAPPLGFIACSNELESLLGAVLRGIALKLWQELWCLWGRYPIYLILSVIWTSPSTGSQACSQRHPTQLFTGILATCRRFDEQHMPEFNSIPSNLALSSTSWSGQRQRVDRVTAARTSSASAVARSCCASYG